MKHFLSVTLFLASIFAIVFIYIPRYVVRPIIVKHRCLSGTSQIQEGKGNMDYASCLHFYNVR